MLFPCCPYAQHISKRGSPKQELSKNLHSSHSKLLRALILHLNYFSLTSVAQTISAKLYCRSCRCCRLSSCCGCGGGGQGDKVLEEDIAERLHVAAVRLVEHLLSHVVLVGAGQDREKSVVESFLWSLSPVLRDLSLFGSQWTEDV